MCQRRTDIFAVFCCIQKALCHFHIKRYCNSMHILGTSFEDRDIVFSLINASGIGQTEQKHSPAIRYVKSLASLVGIIYQTLIHTSLLLSLDKKGLKELRNERIRLMNFVDSQDSE